MRKQPFTRRLLTNFQISFVPRKAQQFPPRTETTSNYYPAKRLCRWLSKVAPALIFRSITAVTLLLVSANLKGGADDSNASSPQLGIQQEDVNSRETLQTILRIEDQLRSNQIATEQNGREAREAAARNAELVGKEMRNIEEAFAAQQGALSERNLRELQAMQSFNRLMLVIGGTFTTVVSLAILMVVHFQWRTSKVWAEISAGQRGFRTLGNGSGATAAVAADTHAVEARAISESNSNLLNALGQLETRVQGLEQGTGLPAKIQDRIASPTENGKDSLDMTGEHSNGQDSIATLLAQGQTQMKANDWEAALKCFDEVLALEPNHSEALVKKGMALERLKKLDEAFAYYDRAITADGSMTIAYLHKGRLCSRLERFKEALECYEKALRTHTESIDSR
jgi:tetratricopeptide (TPR) repeat protein